MEHEHLIRVATGDDAITRKQLWRGLVFRAEQPRHFVSGLDGCLILERTAQRLERELRFGANRIRDQVLFTAAERVRYEIHGAGRGAADTLDMAIEESELGELLVRFHYHVDVHRSGLSDPRHQAVLRQAYTDADQHTVDLIRAFAARGWFA